MTWVCRVCQSEDIEYIFDIPTSKMNKQKKFTIMRIAYCKKHKPAIYNPKIDKIINY